MAVRREASSLPKSPTIEVTNSSDKPRAHLPVKREMCGTGDSQRDSREMIRANHSQSKPLFLQRVRRDSHESLEFPIRANHPIRANRANRFARITPLRARGPQKGLENWCTENVQGGFKRENGPLSLRDPGKRPIKVGERPITEIKRPIKANGLFSGTSRWCKTAPLKRAVKTVKNATHPKRASNWPFP